MKVRIEFIIIFLGLLIVATISIVEPTTVYLTRTSRGYVNQRTGEVTNIRDIDEEWLRVIGEVSFDGAVSGSRILYLYITVAGRLAYASLIGSVFLASLIWIFKIILNLYSTKQATHH